MFDSESDVIVINEWSEFAPRVASRGRGPGSTAKRRITIEIESQPLLHMFDENMLGAKPAEAITQALSKAIKGIAAFASVATLKKRQAAAKAFSEGAAWATKRYSGGRIGAKPPNQTPRLFNDSGRLADGLFVRQNPKDATFTVNVPANRFDEREFTGDAFQRMLNKLRELVPIMQDGRKLLEDAGVRKAIAESIGDLIAKAESNQADKLRALAEARKRLVLAALRAVAEVAAG